MKNSKRKLFAGAFGIATLGLMAALGFATLNMDKSNTQSVQAAASDQDVFGNPANINDNFFRNMLINHFGVPAYNAEGNRGVIARGNGTYGISNKAKNPTPSGSYTCASFVTWVYSSYIPAKVSGTDALRNLAIDDLTSSAAQKMQDIRINGKPAFTRVDIGGGVGELDFKSLPIGSVGVWNDHMGLFMGAGSSAGAGGRQNDGLWAGYMGVGNEPMVSWQKFTYSGSGGAAGIIDGKPLYVLILNPLNKDFTLNLNKSSSNLDFSRNNPNYSLEGAVYEVFQDEGLSNKVGELTTDGSGHGSTGTMSIDASADRLWVKEKTAPKGYKLDQNAHVVNISGDSGSIDVKDKPGDDPLTIQLNKIYDKADGLGNPMSMEGAKFNIKYYPVSADRDWTKDEITAETPSKEWVFQSKKNNAGKFVVLITDRYKVSGPDLIKNAAGTPTFPAGIVTVEETEAPEGYTLKNSTVSVEGNNITTDDGLVIFKVQSKPDFVGVQFGNEFTMNEYSKRGGILNLKKWDFDTERQEPQGDASFQDVEFQVINKNDYDVVTYRGDYEEIGRAGNDEVAATLKFDENGNFSSDNKLLSYGTYELRESKGNGSYLVDGRDLVKQVTIDENDQTIDLSDSPMFDKVVRGGFQLHKNDSDLRVNHGQGDATDLTATYDIINESKKSVVVEGKEYQVGEVVKTFQTDAEGNFQSEADLLPYGTYKIVEKVAPVGYKLKGTVETTFEVRNNGEIVDLTQKIFNDVITGNFEMVKTKSESTPSSLSEYEEGAEFMAILKSYVDNEFNGDFQAAAANVKANFSLDDPFDASLALTPKEWDLKTTNSDGYFKTRDLAYGEYVVGQTGAPKESKPMEDTFTFTVSEEDQPTKRFMANNTPMQYMIRMNKRDAETGSTVVFNSASFKIWDVKRSKFVSMNVGKEKYDTFKTTSMKFNGESYDNVFVANVGDGKAMTPLQIDNGDYEIREVETPWGFTTLQDPIAFTAQAEGVVEVDKNDNKIVEINVDNERAYGKLTINKTLESWEADKSFVNHDDLSGVEFTIKAAEDIISPIDGSVMYKAGDVYRVFNTEADGSAIVDKIDLGKYTLQETAAPKGVVVSDEVYNLNFEQTDQETLVYNIDKDIENKVTKTSVTKTDGTGEKEVPGATITITNKVTGEEVDKWVSTDKPHKIEGLEPGTEYELCEEAAPTGYYFASCVPFTVNEDGSVTKVEMRDEAVNVKIVKVDDSGVELEDAKMELYHVTKDGDVKIDEWTTVREKHDVSNLVTPGETYKVVESEAPAGHFISVERTFQVPKFGPGEEITVTMVDVAGKVNFIKLDNFTRKPVANAMYMVYSLDADGNEVELTRFKTDNNVEGVHKDINGVEIASLMYENTEYFVKEVEAPYGYELDDNSYNFEMVGSKDNKQIVELPQQPKHLYVSVNKVDATTGNSLKGAEITVYKEDGSIAKTFDGKDAVGVSDGKGVILFDLPYDANSKYYAMETKAPEGYILSDKKYEVVPGEDYKFVKENPVLIVVNNEPHRMLVNTNIKDFGVVFGIAAAIFAAIAGLLFFLKKKSNKTNKKAKRHNTKK